MCIHTYVYIRAGMNINFWQMNILTKNEQMFEHSLVQKLTLKINKDSVLQHTIFIL